MTLARGYDGTMPPHAYNVLVLAAESFIQINQVNSIVVEWSQILTKVKECCGVLPLEYTMRRSLYDQVMRAPNISLNADVSPAVKERRVQ
jgi:hypothetical protein